jgi:hypothetical protein
MKNLPKGGYYVHYAVEDENNYTIDEEGHYLPGRDYYCIIGNLSDCDLVLLRQWIKCFLTTDKFFQNKWMGKYAPISNWKFVVNPIPSKEEWEEFEGEDSDVDEEWIDWEEQEEFEEDGSRFALTEDAGKEKREYERECRRQKFLGELITGHDDYQQYIKGKNDSDIRNDTESPYRILHEIVRKAEVIKISHISNLPDDSDLPNNQNMRRQTDGGTLDGSMAESSPQSPSTLTKSQPAIASHNSQRQNESSRKKGGHPVSSRRKWLVEQHDTVGSSYLGICEKWNNLPLAERRKHDREHPEKLYDLSTPDAKKKSIGKVRAVIRRYREKK